MGRDAQTIDSFTVAMIRFLNALMFLLLVYSLGYGFYSVAGPALSALAGLALGVVILWQFNNPPKPRR